MLLNEIINEVGMTKRAVKYYEEKGLLSVDKDNNGYRNYTAQDVETLKKISVYRKLGISIKDIQSLLETGDKSILLRIYQEKVQEKVLKDSELEALSIMSLRTQKMWQSLMRMLLSARNFLCMIPEYRQSIATSGFLFLLVNIQETMAGLLLSLREWIKPHSLLFFEKGGNRWLI